MKIIKYSSVLILAGTISLSLMTEVVNAQAGRTIWMDAPTEGVNLGQGFDLLTGEPTVASCVDFVVEKENGTETFLEIKELNSYVNTMSSLDISGSGKLKMALLSASVKANFANTAEIKSNDKQFSVNARIENGSIYAAPRSDPMTLINNPESVDKKINNNKNSKIRFSDWVFKNEDDTGSILGPEEISATTLCGHGYVSAIVTGAKINAVVDHSFDETKENSSFNGEAIAKFLFFEVKANIDGTSIAKGSTTNSTVKAYLLGGDQTTKLPHNLLDLKKFVKDDLPKVADTASRPIRIAITPYDRLYPKLSGVFKTPEQIDVLLEAFFLTREAASRLHFALNEMQNAKAKTVNSIFRPFTEEEVLILLDDAYWQIDYLRQMISHEFYSSLKSNASDTKVNMEPGNMAFDNDKNNQKDTVFDGFLRAIKIKEEKMEAMKAKKFNEKEIENAPSISAVLSKNAADLYLSALLALPLDTKIEALNDEAVDLNILRLAIENLNKNSEIPTLGDEILEILDSELKAADKIKVSCINKIPEFRFNYNDFPYGEPPQHILDRAGKKDHKLVNNCTNAYKKAIKISRDKAMQAAKDIGIDINIFVSNVIEKNNSSITNKNLEIIIRFLSRNTYRKELSVILRSSCGTGSKALVCKLGYKNLNSTLKEHINNSNSFINNFHSAVAEKVAPIVKETPKPRPNPVQPILDYKTTECSGINHGGFSSFHQCWNSLVEP